MKPARTGWLDVPDWWDHQSYLETPPKYIKLETRFILTEKTRKLTLSERGLLVSVWVALANTGFAVIADATYLRGLLGVPVRQETLNRLLEAGLLVVRARRPDVEASRARARERRGSRNRKTLPAATEEPPANDEPAAPDPAVLELLQAQARKLGKGKASDR